jgi:hypothetical protein
LAVGVTRVHAQQVAGKQGRFITPRASADFDKGGAFVVRVFGQQHALQFVFQLGHLGGSAVISSWPFQPCRHRRRTREHLLRRGQVGFALLKACPAAGHRGHIGVLAREHQKLLHVFHDVSRRAKIQALPGGRRSGRVVGAERVSWMG